MWSLHVMGPYSALKSNDILTDAPTSMNLEDITLSKISQAQKGKYCIITPRAVKFIATESRMVVARN